MSHLESLQMNNQKIQALQTLHDEGIEIRKLQNLKNKLILSPLLIDK